MRLTIESKVDETDLGSWIRIHKFSRVSHFTWILKLDENLLFRGWRLMKIQIVRREREGEKGGKKEKTSWIRKNVLF